MKKKNTKAKKDEDQKLVTLKEINKLLYTYGLNKVIRFGRKREEEFQTQSVAEHVTNIIFCAYYFRDIEIQNMKWILIR